MKENSTTIFNVSLLQLTENPSSVTTVVSVKNSTIVSHAYEWRFVLPPYFIIFLLSISGNCLVITTLASNRRMRTVTNVYLLNLVIFFVVKTLLSLSSFPLEFNKYRNRKKLKLRTNCCIHIYLLHRSGVCFQDQNA